MGSGSLCVAPKVLSFNAMAPRADVVDSKMFQWKQAGPVCAKVIRSRPRDPDPKDNSLMRK